jgi:hypothetical protein
MSGRAAAVALGVVLVAAVGMPGVAEATPSSLEVTATPFTAYSTVPFTGPVASFSEGTSRAPVADYTAVVNWGDGSSDHGTVTQPGGPGTAYEVSDGHTYASPGDYTVSIDVTDVAASGYDAQSTSETVDVTGPPVSITPATIPSQVVGTPFSGEVATFTSSVPTLALDAVAVTLDWGDGTTSAGTVTQPGGTGTQFEVSGTHTYTTSAQYSITVEVTAGGTTTDGSVPVMVNAAQTVVTCQEGCSGGVSSPEESSTVTTGSGSGSVALSLFSGTFACPSATQFETAPQITTVTTTGLASSVVVTVRVRFLRVNLAGTPGSPLRACFAGSEPFTTYGGDPAVQQVIDGQTYYVGLLPDCAEASASLPCLVHHGWSSIPTSKYIVERIHFPAGDPRFH